MQPIRIGDRDYTWAELSRPDVRRLPQVQAAIAAVQRDPAAFGLTPADVRGIVQHSTGAFDGFSESQLYEATVGQQAEALPQAEAAKGENMATKLIPGANAPAIDPATAFRKMAELMVTPGMTTALRRREQGLSARHGADGLDSAPRRARGRQQCAARYRESTGWRHVQGDHEVYSHGDTRAGQAAAAGASSRRAGAYSCPAQG